MKQDKPERKQMPYIDQNSIIAATERELMALYELDIKDATTAQLHNALSNSVMRALAPFWRKSRDDRAKARRAYYLSAEYLMGRQVYANLYNLGILEEVGKKLGERGVDIGVFEAIDDAALGNGGLGRLAACFLESAATHAIPLDGYGLRYRFGLFRQTFQDGFQLEKADDWQRTGDPWSRRRDDKTVEVAFTDQRVLAVPYDMPIIGYGTENIETLRLWQSEPVEEFDFALFNAQEYALAVREKNSVEDITRVLYPNDTTRAGKRLRLKQQYFLSSATLQDILRRYIREHGRDMAGFASHCAIQLNDTHPTVSIPELIRLLMREGVGFDAAFDTAREVFSYTNHTIMAEALECWETELFTSVIPELYDIIVMINERMNRELDCRCVSTQDRADMQIITGTTIHMARLAIYASHAVNGVAKIHTDIIKGELFRDWYRFYPERFQNKTNGVTQRRFLGLANPELTSLISEKIGARFMRDLYELDKLRPMIDDELVRRFNEVKLTKKRQLAKIILEREGVELPEGFAFDVQVKRMHEYKRQLMNALAMLDIYFSVKDGTLRDFTPTAFIFGAKAAPGYVRAKAVIKLINEAAKLINSDPAVRDYMRAVFVTNYDCSYAEHIIPAADISEQISPAGTEASGTGNMKLMLNGAVTLGTYDGANIEIVERAGLENSYIFGATVDEIRRVRDSYDPRAIYEADPRVRRALDTLVNGTLSDSGTGTFREIYESILSGANWHKPDQYFVLYDLMPYIEAKLRALRDYRDPIAFGRRCLMNVAGAGMFSADRAVMEYARDIWRVEPAESIERRGE